MPAPQPEPSAPASSAVSSQTPGDPHVTPRPRSLARRLVALAFYGAVAAALVWYLRQLDYAALARIEIDWSWLAAAAFVGCAHRFMQPVVWALMLRSLGHRVTHYATYNSVYAKGWVGRYLPGKVSMVAVRVYLAETLGASRIVIGIAGVAEIGVQILVGLSAGLVGITFMPTDIPALAELEPLAWAAAGVLALVLFPPVFNGALRAGMRLLRRSDQAPPAVGPRTLVSACAGYGAASLLAGLHAVLVAAAIDPVAFEHPIFLWGAIHLAASLGMLVVVAPSGLGAREGVYLALCTAVFAPEAALGIVVLSRLMDLVVDALFYIASVAWERLSRRR